MLSHAEKGARRRMGARTPIKGYGGEDCLHRAVVKCRQLKPMRATILGFKIIVYTSSRLIHLVNSLSS